MTAAAHTTPDPARGELGPIRRVRVIVNPAAGQDKPILAILNRVFRSEGITWDVDLSHASGDAMRFAQRALESRAAGDVLAVSGGDGTVSEVAGVLAGSDLPLAVLPGGTGNVVAQELGLPLGYEAAAQALFAGPVEARRLDLLDCGERSCVLRVGLGADARLIEAADRDAKDTLGWGAYLRAAVEQVTQGECSRFAITIDGARRELDALAVVVLNIGRIGRGGGRLAAGIDPSDGLLDVLVVREGTLSAVVELARQWLDEARPLPTLGEASDDAPVLLASASAVTIEPRGDVALQIDGEKLPALRAGTPLSVRVHPGAVRFIAPRPSQDTNE
ncbi:MAG: diacylglycerol kinase family lipid kinase [Planctomycetota bacterium]